MKFPNADMVWKNHILISSFEQLNKELMRFSKKLCEENFRKFPREYGKAQGYSCSAFEIKSLLENIEEIFKNDS